MSDLRDLVIAIDNPTGMLVIGCLCVVGGICGVWHNIKMRWLWGWGNVVLSALFVLVGGFLILISISA